jgi:tripartite-type tricarboxylate transporter receptor subunit TctC
VKDFTPISRVTTFDFAVTAGPGAPAGDLKAVLAWMKANPTKANYATSGAGTVPHFAGLLLGQAAGVPMTHVAYRGGAPAAQDLIGGQVPLMVDTASETIEHHKAGKVRILAVTGDARSKALPDVPTLKESGINIAADAFFGLYGPAGMAPDVVARIDRAVADALKAPDVQDKIYGFGLVPNHAGAAALSATQAEHLKRWEAPIKASGFKAE